VSIQNVVLRLLTLTVEILFTQFVRIMSVFQILVVAEVIKSVKVGMKNVALIIKTAPTAIKT